MCAEMWLRKTSSISSDETGEPRLAVVAWCSSSEDQCACLFVWWFSCLSPSRFLVRSVSEAVLFYRDHIYGYLEPWYHESYFYRGKRTSTYVHKAGVQHLAGSFMTACFCSLLLRVGRAAAGHGEAMQRRPPEGTARLARAQWGLWVAARCPQAAYEAESAMPL